MLDIPDNLRGVIDKYSSELDILSDLMFQEMGVLRNPRVRATVGGVGWEASCEMSVIVN